MNTDQIAAEAAEKVLREALPEEWRGYREPLLIRVSAIIKDAIEKARGIKTTEYAKWWDDHVAAVRSSHAAHASDATKDADGRCIRCGQSPSFCKCTESAHANEPSKCSQCGTELQVGSLTAAAHASDLGKTTPKHFDEDGTFHPEEKPAHASERVFEALRDLFALVESGVLVRDISHDADPKWYLKAIELTQVLARAKAALSAHASEADG